MCSCWHHAHYHADLRRNVVKIHFGPGRRLGSTNACALVQIHHQECTHVQVRHNSAWTRKRAVVCILLNVIYFCDALWGPFLPLQATGKRQRMCARLQALSGMYSCAGASGFFVNPKTCTLRTTTSCWCTWEMCERVEGGAMGECVCLSVVRETVSTIDLTLLARTDDTEMRVKDSHHKMTTNRNCGLCCQLKGKSIKTEHCCSQCGVTLNPTGCLKQYHSREPDFRLTHALAGLGNANMSRNCGAAAEKT